MLARMRSIFAASIFNEISDEPVNGVAGFVAEVGSRLGLDPAAERDLAGWRAASALSFSSFWHDPNIDALREKRKRQS